MKQTPRQTNSCQGAQTPRQRELNTKRRGELAEIAFAHKAIAQGFAVSKPFGDSERYDFILDGGQALWRIQVKSSTHILSGLYHVNAHRRTMGTAVPYLPNEVDFLVAYIIPEDSWFILPLALIQSRTSLLFSPKNYYRGQGIYGAYREAWHQLRQPRKCQACGSNV
jgi:hypothetical protein